MKNQRTKGQSKSRISVKSIGEIERSLNVYKKLKFVGSWSQARFNYSTALLTIGNFKKAGEIMNIDESYST